MVDSRKLKLNASKAAKSASTVLMAGGSALGAAPHALSLIGFTTTGVVRGSIAAGIQSYFYGGTIASGSLFSIAQSVGAAGLGPVGMASMGAMMGVSILLSHMTKQSAEDKKDRLLMNNFELTDNESRRGSDMQVSVNRLIDEEEEKEEGGEGEEDRAGTS